MKKNGFTLVELAVTVVLVVILTSISVPLYKANTRNVKLTEGYALLATIRSAQERYYVENGEFLVSSQASGGEGVGINNSVFTCEEKVLGINARTNRYFSLFCINGEKIGDKWVAQLTKSAFCAIAQYTGTCTLKMFYNLSSGVTFEEYRSYWD